MALIKCPECGNNISDKSERCIHCGCDFHAVLDITEEIPDNASSLDVSQETASPPTKTNNSTKKIISIVAAIAAVAAIVLLVAHPFSSKPSNNAKESPADVQENSVVSDDTDTEKKDLEGKETTFKSIDVSPDNMRPVFVDTDSVKVSMHSFDYANDGTVFELFFRVENNSNETISVTLEDVEIDDYEISTATAKTIVDAGHNAICDSTLWQEDIDDAHIEDWDSFSAMVCVCDSDYNVVYQTPITVQKSCWEAEKTYTDDYAPVKEKEIEIEDGVIVISADNDSPIIYDGDECFVAIDSFPSSDGAPDYETDILLENKSNKVISVRLENIVINDYEISYSVAKSYVKPGNKGICDSSIWNEDLDRAHIDKWSALSANVVIRWDYDGDEIASIPVVIYKEVWD